MPSHFDLRRAATGPRVGRHRTADQSAPHVAGQRRGDGSDPADAVDRLVTQVPVHIRTLRMACRPAVPAAIAVATRDRKTSSMPFAPTRLPRSSTLPVLDRAVQSYGSDRSVIRLRGGQDRSRHRAREDQVTPRPRTPRSTRESRVCRLMANDSLVLMACAGERLAAARRAHGSTPGRRARACAAARSDEHRLLIGATRANRASGFAASSPTARGAQVDRSPAGVISTRRSRS